MGGQNWQVCSLLFLAVCVPLATSLTRECSSVRTPCILQYNIDQDFSTDPCVTASRYVQCLVNVLVPARQGGTCSPVSALTYFNDLYLESKVYTQFCPSFVIPNSLELDECQKEIAVCGRFSSDAFIATSANNVTLCRSNSASFTSCMDSETRSCSDRAQIAQYRQLDLAEMACDSITTTTTRVTTTTPTTTTTTRSPTTTTTTTPSTSPTTTTTTTTTSRPTTTTTTTTRPITTTLFTTTTARPINGVYTNPCASESVRNGSMMYFPDATDRTRFWHCTPWGGAYLMGCGQGTRWNQEYLACVWA